MEKSFDLKKKKKVLTGKIISLYGEDKTGFEIFLSPIFFSDLIIGMCVCVCVRKERGRGALKRHIIGWQTLFSLFVIFPFFWFSNFGHVTKFFLFSERIFFFFFLFPPVA
jgi:hypothetical protein